MKNMCSSIGIKLIVPRIDPTGYVQPPLAIMNCKSAPPPSCPNPFPTYVVPWSSVCGSLICQSLLRPRIEAEERRTYHQYQPGEFHEFPPTHQRPVERSKPHDWGYNKVQQPNAISLAPCWSSRSQAGHSHSKVSEHPANFLMARLRLLMDCVYCLGVSQCCGDARTTWQVDMNSRYLLVTSSMIPSR